jgi:hypothetical protein
MQAAVGGPNLTDAGSYIILRYHAFRDFFCVDGKYMAVL